MWPHLRYTSRRDQVEIVEVQFELQFLIFNIHIIQSLFTTLQTLQTLHRLRSAEGKALLALEALNFATVTEAVPAVIFDAGH